MKTFIPGTMSPKYLEALRLNQVKFLESITMSKEKAAWVRKIYPPPPSLELPPHEKYMSKEKVINAPREQGWLQKVIEDADKRVKDWPDWKKELVSHHNCSSSGEESSKGG